MGEVPIGLLLSGGLDSSSIAYYMQNCGVNFKAYSLGFPEINEFEFSRDIARQFGFDYMEICMTQEELFAGMDSNILRMDEPIADPACFALSRLWKISGKMSPWYFPAKAAMKCSADIINISPLSIRN